MIFRLHLLSAYPPFRFAACELTQVGAFQPPRTHQVAEGIIKLLKSIKFGAETKMVESDTNDLKVFCRGQESGM